MRHAGLRASGTTLVSTAALTLAALTAGLTLPAMAQAPAEKEINIQPKPAAAPAAKPAAKPAAAGATAAAEGGGAKSAWVKLCEKAPIVKKDKEGKEVKEDKNLCLTHHERLDGNTGMVLVSAAIRQIEGQDKQSLMVMVPLGMALPPGLRAAIYTKDQWAAAAKNEKIDEKALKPIDLKFSLCHPAGCTAETEATKDIMDQMAAGGGIMILAINAGAQPVGFPVPLEGYVEAQKGAPVDNKKYAEARSSLMKQIRERQAQAAEKYRADLAAKKAAAGAAPATTGSTPAPAAPKAP